MIHSPFDAEPAPLAHRLTRHPERERQGLPPRDALRDGVPPSEPESERDLP